MFALGAIGGAALVSALGGSNASAQTHYTMCGALTLPGASNGADLNGQPPEHPIHLAAGWTPVGGGQYRDGLPTVVVCH